MKLIMGLIADDNDKKPFFRVWAKRKLKAKTKPENIKDILISIKLSSSEEWLILEGKETVSLLSAESKAGLKFWEFCQQLEGELNTLIITPARNKNGFDVEVNPKAQTVWYQDVDADRVYNDFFLKETGKVSGTDSLSTLSMDKMKPSMPS